MENNRNDDIFSLIANTVIKWYEQTHIAITQIKPISPLDIELMGIVLAARQQTLGALATLAHNHILPTHALLRCLLETHIVLAWILNGPV